MDNFYRIMIVMVIITILGFTAIILSIDKPNDRRISDYKKCEEAGMDSILNQRDGEIVCTPKKQ